ncbi:MAG: hypothetical protein CL472_09160, partial [Acidobacteria bacterium]|nr:hypothetical protein [Acidobacteriota bacterium]
MVAIFTGLGAGFGRGSGSSIGAAGLLGSAALGRSGQGVSVNTVTGNRLIAQRDELLTGRGLDASISRTYNSLAELSDGDNGDNWQQSSWRRVFGLTGTLNTAGSTISRQGADGSNVTYSWKTIGGVAAYWATDGDGAHDMLVKNGSRWVWTDGATQIREIYEASTADASSFRIQEQKDTDGYKLSFSYVAGTDKLYRITTANDGVANTATGVAEQSYIEYVWSGNNIAQIVTGYTDYGDASTEADNVNKVLSHTWYEYSGNKLIRVRTDLTPEDNSLPSLGESYWTQYGYDGSGRINLITEKDGSSLAISYDGAGRVLTMTQTVASGDTRVTSFAYGLHDSGDPANINYTAVTGPDGQVTRLYADDLGQLRKITAPPAYTGATAQSVSYGYDADGNLTSVTDAAGKTSNYSYDASGNLLTSTDPLGNVVTRTYGAKNELLTETRTGADASGAAVTHTVRYAYDIENHLRYVVAADGRVTEYRYNGYGLLQTQIEYPEQTYPTGTGPITEADLSAWRNAIPDRSSTKMQYHFYDGRGNLSYVTNFGYATVDGTISSSEGYSKVWTTYDQNGRLLSRCNQGENAETFVYDGMGRVVSATDLAGGTTTYVFNDTASTTTITTSTAETITRTYNKAAELISETRSGSYDVTATETYKYDKNGRVRMVTDGTGRSAYYLYDKAGQKIADIGNDGQISEYRYDAAGRIAATVSYTNVLTAAQLTMLADPNNMPEVASIRPAAHADDQWTWSIYDSAGRLIERIDGSGGVATFEYDKSDRLVKTTRYANKLSVTAYKTTAPTALVVPTSSTQDSISRTFYDADGKVIGVLDGEGYLSEIIYDNAGQKVEEVAYAAKTNASYWASGTFNQLRSSAAPTATANRRLHYVYDGQGQLRYSVDGAGFATGFTYNNAGRLTKTVVYAAAISTSDYSYDAVKALVAAVANAGNDRTSTLAYNALGQVTTSVDAGGLNISYTYDAAGRVVKSVAGTGAGARTTRNWYTAGGDLRFSVDAEGYVHRYDYDAESRLTREITWANRITVTDATTIADVNGLASSAGSWVDVKYGYDGLGRRNSVIDGTGFETRYSWYANGTLESVYSAFNTADQTRTVYCYDGAGRITAEYAAYSEAEQTVVQYAYDGLGNRVSMTDARNTTTTYGYDDRGLLLSVTDALGGMTSSEYNAFGEVVKATDARGNASYTYYDSLGRVVKTRDAESYVTAMAYTAFGELASVTRYYTRTTSAVSTTTQPSVTANAKDATSYFTYDKRGLVTVSTDAEGHAEYSTYDAFGNLVLSQNRIGGETEYTYDKRGQLISERVQHADNNNPGDWVTNSFVYDARGNLVTRIEGDGLRTTSYVYDKANRLVETIGQAFQGITPHSYIAYDACGRVTRTTDPSGAKTFFYDDLGHKTVEINATGTYTRYIYDANGNVTEARVYEAVSTLPTDGGSEEEAPVAPGPDYRKTAFTYDALNRLLTTSSTGVIAGVSGIKTGAWNGSSWVSSNSPITTAIEYDAIGNIVKQTDGNANIVWSYYDKLGRKTAQVDSDRYRTDWLYDSEGNVLTETRYANQAAVPTSTTTPPTVTTNASADRITNFTYDKTGNRLTEQRMNVVIHNGTGGTTTVNATIHYWYNAVGQVIQKDEATDTVSADESIYYEYDMAGRLITERHAGYLASDGNPASPTTFYQYNGLDDLVSVTQYGSGALANRVTSYTYSGDKLTSVTDAGGFTRYFKYDAAGRITHEYYTRLKSDGTAVAAYEGTLTSYDALGRLLDQWQATSSNGSSWTAVTPVASTRYNSFGEVEKFGINAADVAEASRNWQQQNYYDFAGRLWATNSGDGVWKYFGYDKNGNQTAAITSAGVNLTGKTFDQALALVSNAGVNGTFTTYDARGLATSVVEEGRQLSATSTLTSTTTRSYNAFGEVVSETNALGATVSYSYNTMGRRIRVESPTVQITLENGGTQWVKPSEDYYYDAAGRLVATRDANGTYPAGGTSAAGTSKAANSGNLTRLTLLAGTGYGGSQALVTAEIHADGGV